MKTINFTKAKLHQFKMAYNWAIAQGHDRFEFEGNPILVSYAKYLIQYLETHWPSTTTTKVILQ